jgi:hypothetical protein
MRLCRWRPIPPVQDPLPANQGSDQSQRNPSETIHMSVDNPSERIQMLLPAQVPLPALEVKTIGLRLLPPVQVLIWSTRPDAWLQAVAVATDCYTNLKLPLTCATPGGPSTTLGCTMHTSVLSVQFYMLLFVRRFLIHALRPSPVPLQPSQASTSYRYACSVVCTWRTPWYQGDPPVLLQPCQHLLLIPVQQLTGAPHLSSTVQQQYNTAVQKAQLPRQLRCDTATS